MNISELIADVYGSDPERAKFALQKLIDCGSEAVQPILKALNQQEPQTQRSQLNEALLEMPASELVPLLTDSLNATNIDLSITAFQILGSSGEESAISPLVERLVDPKEIGFRKNQAARALGELGSQCAVEPLLNVAHNILGKFDRFNEALERLLQKVEESSDIAPLTLIIEIATSLAKLGNHSLAPVVIGITQLNPEESNLADLDEISLIRSQSAQALCHTVGSGMLTALQKAVCEGDAETRDAALEALFYLGLPESIETLLSRIDDASSQVANNALVWFNRLTGTNFEPFEDDPENVRAWWADNRDGYVSNTCYRLGKSASVEEVIQQLRISNSTPDIVRELYIITGKNLSYEQKANPHEELFVLGQRWWNSQDKGYFIPGRLYKYGYEQDLAVARSPIL